MIGSKPCCGQPRYTIATAMSSSPQFFWSIFSMFFITFCLILPWMCNDWAFSLYMSSGWSRQDLASRVLESNKDRVQIARKHISSLEIASSLSYYKSLLRQDEVDIAVVVVTVQRLHQKMELGYLTQVMARFDQMLQNDAAFPSKVLFICNTHAGPGLHREADYLSQYFPTVSRFNEPSAQAAIMNKFEKEKQDYIFCLQEAREYHPKYVLMVEDDALPNEDLFSILSHVMDHGVEKRHRAGEVLNKTSQWAYLKLYYPEKWQGYGNELRPMLELFALGIIGGSLFTAALHTCFIIRKSVAFHAELVTFILGAVYWILLAVAIGRQYLLSLKRMSPHLYSVIPAPDCCSPGLLFPAQLIQPIADHLNRVTCTASFGVDLAIDNFIVQNDYQRYLVEPNLFTHIGYISTTKGPSRYPEQFLF